VILTVRFPRADCPQPARPARTQATVRAGGRVPLEPGHHSHLYCTRIKSSDKRTWYDTCQLGDGRWTCPCRGFGYREDCRHVREGQLEKAAAGAAA
jgi:hypothetical protein